jgi:hypothetical protein
MIPDHFNKAALMQRPDHSGKRIIMPGKLRLRESKPRVCLRVCRTRVICAQRKLPAHVLPAVLVISVLAMLFVVFSVSLWDMHSILQNRYHGERQIRYHLESGITLYCNDSTFMQSIDDDGGYLLFQDDTSSYVMFSTGDWGLYEHITVISGIDSTHVTRLLGKAYENDIGACFWLSQKNRALSLLGDARLEGKTYVPLSGVNYMQTGTDHYKGEMMADSLIHLSDDSLPSTDTLRLGQIDSLVNASPDRYPSLPGNMPYAGFNDSTLHYSISGHTGGLSARGKIVLHGDHVRLDASARLNDVILVASSVVIEEGFSGTLQIFAKDTVLVNDNVRLDYPSGVMLTGNSRDTFLKLGNNSEINGYAIVLGKKEESFTSVHANYIQGDSAALNGLLYVAGNAVITGRIRGAVYLTDCWYRSGEAFYACALYDAHISRSDDLAWPLWFKAGYNRREIKKLHSNSNNISGHEE